MLNSWPRTALFHPCIRESAPAGVRLSIDGALFAIDLGDYCAALVGVDAHLLVDQRLNRLGCISHAFEKLRLRIEAAIIIRIRESAREKLVKGLNVPALFCLVPGICSQRILLSALPGFAGSWAGRASLAAASITQIEIVDLIAATLSTERLSASLSSPSESNCRMGA